MSFISNALKPVGSFIGNTVGDFMNPISQGITQQTNFNALSPEQQAAFLKALNQSQANAQATYGNEDALAKMLAAQASGTGPDPAAAMLQNQTEANAKGAASQAASTRGASANPGLVARQAAEAAANANQAAAGQGAALKAQQQLAAEGAQAGVLNNMGNQSIAGQSAASTGYMQGQGLNQGVALANTAADNQTTMGLIGGASSAVAPHGGGKAHGGIVHDMSEGGVVPGTPKVDRDSSMNDFIHAVVPSGSLVVPISHMGNKDDAMAFVHAALAHGGNSEDSGAPTPAMLSPTEAVIPPDKAKNEDLAKEFIAHLIQQESTEKHFGHYAKGKESA